MATAHRNANHIRSILIEDREDMKEGMVGFYSKLYADNGEWRPKLDGVSFNTLESDDRCSLELPFSEEEVLSALRGMSKDKAPGPDGFTMAFFSHCWEVIKDNVMEVFRFFHSNICFEKSFNATFIALIPKKKGASSLSDFRPISLIGSVYKLLAKVLSLRLRKVVGKLVLASQHAFVGERQIIDASFIANEAVDDRVLWKVSRLGLIRIIM